MDDSKINPPPKFRLRKLRKGVTLKFNGYDLEGIPHWLIHDPGRNNFFAIGWPEYEMLLRWDLADGQAIIDAVNKDTTLQLELQDFENLREFLYNNYLVEHRWRNVYQKAKEQKLIKTDNLLHWLLKYYLFFRIPLFKPDKFLDRTKFFADFLFNKYTAYAMGILGIVALYQIGIRWEEFVHTFSSIFSMEGLFFYLIAFTVAKLFHELGHAYMCRQYGVSVPTIGVAFLVFWPVLYTDTTLSWSLPSQKRLRITMAGMWVETYITIIAALIWCNVHNVTVQMICYVTVAVNWTGTLLINISPFMRFDGYYALSDLLKMPNLQSRAFELTRWQIRNWLFGLEEPMHEPFSKKMHRFLVAYSLITWAYRLVIYFGIAVLVYHYFFKVVGIILFIIEVYAFILRPVFFEITKIYQLREQIRFNFRTRMTLLVSALVIFCLFLPLNRSVTLNATLGYEHEFLSAPMEAVLKSELPTVGTFVKKQEVVVELQSMDVVFNLKKALLEFEKAKIKIRRASINPSFMTQKSNLLAEQNEKKADYEKWLTMEDKLHIKAPFDGKIVDVEESLRPGVVVMKNEYLLDIINPNSQVVEAFVEESDLASLSIGDVGFFYPNNLDLPVIPVKIYAIETMNTPELAFEYSKQIEQRKHNSNNREFVVDTPSYLASDLGGKIPTQISDDRKYVPVDSVYRVLLKPDKTLEIKNIQAGSVIISVKPRSFSDKTIQKVKNVFVKESGF